MTLFSFPTSPEARAYCERILDEMVRLFKISRSDALDRMNEYWEGLPLESPEDVSLLTHDLPEDWAKQLYYGPNIKWWLEKQDDPKTLPTQ